MCRADRDYDVRSIDQGLNHSLMDQSLRQLDDYTGFLRWRILALYYGYTAARPMTTVSFFNTRDAEYLASYYFLWGDGVTQPRGSLLSHQMTSTLNLILGNLLTFPSKKDYNPSSPT